MYLSAITKPPHDLAARLFFRAPTAHELRYTTLDMEVELGVDIGSQCAARE